MRQSIRLACKFRYALNHCYFHHSRDKCYASHNEKEFARSAMIYLWNCESLAVDGMCFGKNHIRYIMLNEMMPEHLDAALNYCKNNQITDESIFANMILRIILFSEETARMKVTFGCYHAANSIPVFFRRRRIIRVRLQHESEVDA